MKNKEFIKRNIHFNNKNNMQKKNGNVIISILNAFQGVLGLIATVCWVILLAFIVLITLGQSKSWTEI